MTSLVAEVVEFTWGSVRKSDHFLNQGSRSGGLVITVVYNAGINIIT